MMSKCEWLTHIDSASALVRALVSSSHIQFQWLPSGPTQLPCPHTLIHQEHATLTNSDTHFYIDNLMHWFMKIRVLCALLFHKAS